MLIKASLKGFIRGEDILRIISGDATSNSVKVIGNNGEDLTQLLSIRKITIVMEPRSFTTAILECNASVDIKLTNYHYYFNEQALQKSGRRRQA